MKPNGNFFSLFTAAFLAVNGAAVAHEECDDREPSAQDVVKPAQVSAPQMPSSAEITVKLFQYQPGRAQVKTGTTVTWVNEDEIYHSVTADKNGFDAPIGWYGQAIQLQVHSTGSLSLLLRSARAYARRDRSSLVAISTQSKIFLRRGKPMKNNTGTINRQLSARGYGGRGVRANEFIEIDEFNVGHSMHDSMTSKDGKWTAADLRANLNALLGEHVLIAAVATSHALGGREAAFNGAAGGLDANSVDLSKAIGAVYGADAEKAFLPLWRKHIGFFVDYTTGVASKDKAKQDKAVADWSATARTSAPS